MKKRNKLLPIFAANMTAYQNAVYDLCGVNRTACANRANMSKGQWSDLLNGNIPSPGVWTAARIADALGVTIDDLITSSPDKRATAIQAAVNYHDAIKRGGKSRVLSKVHSM